MSRSRLTVLALAIAFLACSDDEAPTAGPVYIKHYDQAQEWTCASSESCQDVFDIQFAAGTTATFRVTDLTDGSPQLALYAPGVPLGEMNLFTGTNNEYGCNSIGNCFSIPQNVIDFPLSMGGTYRLAVTRDSSESCGDTGTYRVIISADKRFVTPVRTVNDVATLAPGTECPVVTR